MNISNSNKTLQGQNNKVGGGDDDDYNNNNNTEQFCVEMSL
jgi:hypothetical protein